MGGRAGHLSDSCHASAFANWQLGSAPWLYGHGVGSLRSGPDQSRWRHPLWSWAAAPFETVHGFCILRVKSAI